MNITTKIALGILASIVLISGYLFLKKDDQQPTDDTFIVGIASGYAPFVSINAQGDYEGFDIDVANALAQQMGKKLVLKDMGSMAPLFIALQQETIDAIMWGLSMTHDRLAKVDMVRYQGQTVTAYPLLFWQTIPEGVQRIDDMHGMTVAVEPASAQEAVLDTYPFINKLPTEKIDDALLHIQHGKADAALVEPAIAKKFKRKYPAINIVQLPLTPAQQEHGIGIAIKNNNTARKKQIENGLNALRRNGILQQYEQKWDL